MKIGIINSIYKPETRGGAEVVVENITLGLKKRGHEVFVISAGRQDEVLTIAGVKVYKIKSRNLFNFFDLGNQPDWKRACWHIIDMFNDLQTWKIYQILKREQPDLVLTHSLKGLGYEIPRLLKILKIRHLHSIHDVQLIDPAGIFNDEVNLPWPYHIYLVLCRLLFGSPTAVIFPSEYFKNIYQRFHFFKKSALLVLGNPLPPDAVIKLAKPEIGPVLTFAFVGQVEEYKGIIDLVKAVNNLSGDWQLLVAGDGAALTEAKQLSLDNKKIKFLGRLTQAELEHKIWSVADLLITPSRVPESFGMVVVEAQSHGIPALVARIGALGQLVQPNVTGWFFKPKDQFDLQRQVEFILANREKVQPLKQRCLEAARQYTIDAYLEKVLNHKFDI